MNKPLILVVEDDPSVRNLITTTLKTNDYRYVEHLMARQPLWRPHRTILKSSYWIWACRIWMAFKSFKRFAPGPMFRLL